MAHGLHCLVHHELRTMCIQVCVGLLQVCTMYDRPTALCPVCCNFILR